MLVETCGCRVDRVDDDHACRGKAAGRDRAGERVPKQLSTKTLAVQRTVERQSRKQHRRNRIRRSATDPAGQLRADHEVGREAEVRDDAAITCMPHECPRGTHAFRVCRAVSEPAVEGGLA